MKNLYFWNDFNVFFHDEALLLQIEKIFSDFFKEISNGETNYTYLSYLDLNTWKRKLQPYIEKPNIYIGTRPDKLFDLKAQGAITIYPKRKRDSSGKTSGVTLSDKDRKIISEYLQRESEIRIIEDALVCGVTMESLLDEIFSEIKTKNVIVEVFLVNQESQKRIQAKYGNKLRMDNYMQMNGISIEDSTCICAYDLLDGRIKGMDYDESYEKLKRFFGEFTNDFLDLYKEIRNALKIECKRE